MLDLIPQRAVDSANIEDRVVQVRHKNIDDVSLYERFGQIRRVPLEALTSTPDKTPTGEVIRDIVEPTRLDDFHALQNKATGALLNVRPVGKHYALVPHDELFAQQAEILADSNIPLDDVDVLDRIYEQGARVHRTIHFNDMQSQHDTKSGQPDVVRCRMDIFNSVDMSWAFQIFSGAYRDLCRNTLVFGGEKAYHQRRVHRGALSPEAMIEKAALGLDMWQNQKDQMTLWRKSPLTDRVFAGILKDTICKKNTKAAAVDENLSVNERRLNWMLERFSEEKKELGSTLWAGFNALTHWSTHLPDARKEGRNECKRYTRSDQVRHIVDGSAWRSLELAA